MPVINGENKVCFGLDLKTPETKRVSNRIHGLVGRNLKTIIEALWAAKLWEDSIADAHYFALSPHNRTPENKRIASRHMTTTTDNERIVIWEKSI
jgi:hypothetical protein